MALGNFEVPLNHTETLNSRHLFICSESLLHEDLSFPRPWLLSGQARLNFIWQCLVFMEAASEPKVPVLGSQSRPKLGRREVGGGGEPLVLSADRKSVV